MARFSRLRRIAMYLLAGRLDGLLDKVDEIGRAQFSQSLQVLCADLYHRGRVILEDPVCYCQSVDCDLQEVIANSGTAVWIIVAGGCVLKGPCASKEKEKRQQTGTLLPIQAVALSMVVSCRSLLLLFNERAIISSLASPRASAT
jgi:hypothetical protein